MTPLETFALTSLVGAVGVALGWAVSGHQRVTEKLTEERREAFHQLIAAARSAHESAKKATPAFEDALVRAEFVSSKRLRQSEHLPRLRASIGTDTFETDLAGFMTIARQESIYNAWVLRWWVRKWYAQTPSSLPRE